MDLIFLMECHSLANVAWFCAEYNTAAATMDGDCKRIFSLVVKGEVTPLMEQEQNSIRFEKIEKNSNFVLIELSYSNYLSKFE